MSAYENIVEGLNEAIAFAQGRITGALAHRNVMQQADVNDIGDQTRPAPLAMIAKRTSVVSELMDDAASDFNDQIS